MSTFCEVICNFGEDDLDILATYLPPSPDTIVFTDSLAVLHGAKQFGYDAHEIRYYFGYEDPDSVTEIDNQSMQKLRTLMNVLEETKYDGISIVEGLQSVFLDQLIFLEKIKFILSKYKKNIVFLLEGLSYYYYSITIIARAMGFQTKLGGLSRTSKPNLVPLIMDVLREARDHTLSPSDFVHIVSALLKEILTHQSGFKHQDFDATLAWKYKDIYLERTARTNEIIWGSDSDLQKFLPSIDSIAQSNPKHAFFAMYNREDFVLKPIYPVLQEFLEMNVGHVVFCYSSLTARHLTRRNVIFTDLSDTVRILSARMLKRNKNTISAIMMELKKIPLEENTLRAYMMILFNDRFAATIAKTLSVIVITKFIINKFDFQSVLVGADGVLENDLVCKIANSMNIQTYSIPPGIVEYYPNFGILYKAKHLLLSGDHLKNNLKRIGIDDKRLVITGSPRYDYITRNVKGNNKNPTTRKILVAMSRFHENDEKWMVELIHFCNSNGMDIMIKRHPGILYSKDLRKVGEQKDREIQKSCAGENFQISYDGDVSTLFPDISILVTENSLLGVEASLHEKQIIVVNMNNDKYYHNSLQYHKEGIALYATSIDKLFECINKIFNDADMRSELSKARKRLNYEFNYLNDGKASARVFESLNHAY